MDEINEIAILMAAGLGTRMRPLTDKTPKPLVKVGGKPMIETVIQGLRARGVEQIVVVVGYLSEQFSYLVDAYPGVKLVSNPDYDTMNNVSSIRAAADIMRTGADCWICEADLYIEDPALFDVPMVSSCYFGKMVPGYSDDWVFDVDTNGRITRVGTGGDDLYNMVGVSWWRADDAQLVADAVEQACTIPENSGLFWDDIVNQNLDVLDLQVHPVQPGQILELDTIADLASVDSSYTKYLH